jgi:predicted oxidoreductase
MNKVYLSDAGPKVSPAIYGFWRWTAQEGNMEKIVNLCLELGVNTFDHADRYGDYTCEKRFGEVLAKRSFQRSDVVLFSKCGVNPTPKFRVNHINSSAEHIIKSVENSLQNLRTDYLDVFLLDQLDPLSDIEATAHALEKLKSAGKVKNIGVSAFTVHQHQLLVSYLNIPIVSNHIDLNLLNTSALDNGVIDYIKQKYMRPLATSPLAGGRIEHGTDEKALKLRKKLNQIATKYNATIESIAVAWLVKVGALPLIGTLEENRIRNIVDSFQIELDHEDWYDLLHASRNTEEVGE